MVSVFSKRTGEECPDQRTYSTVKDNTQINRDIYCPDFVIETYLPILLKLEGIR